MRQITLETEDGRFVSEHAIPPFVDGFEPSVILWGTRFFKLLENNIYRECFVYAIPWRPADIGVDSFPSDSVG